MKKFSIVMTSVGLGSKTTEPSKNSMFDNKEDAKAKAKRLNALLTVGEKKYYKCRFKVVEI